MLGYILAAMLGFFAGKSYHLRNKSLNIRKSSPCCDAIMWETRLGNKVCTVCKRKVEV